MAKGHVEVRVADLPEGVMDMWLYLESAIANAVGDPEGVSVLLGEQHELNAKHGIQSSTMREMQNIAKREEEDRAKRIA